MASVDLNGVLPPAMPSIVLPLEHLESGDYFQQMLSADSALTALKVSGERLTLKAQSWATSKGVKVFGPSHTQTPSFDWKCRKSDIEGLDVQATAEYYAMRQSFINLNTLVKAFGELQAGARHYQMLRARSLRRGKTGISIMSLPNELLRKIVINFRPPLGNDAASRHFEANETDISSIKNVRLTCRRFCDCSSDLLIRRLSISLRASSLNRLEGIARNPDICKGVQILNIDLRYYSAALAQDLQAFSAMCYQKLEDMTAEMKQEVEEAEGRNEHIRKQREEKKRRREQGDENQEESNKEYEESTETGEESEWESEWDGEESEEGSEDREEIEIPVGTDYVYLKDAKDSVLNTQRFLSSWEPFKNGTPIEESTQPGSAVLALREGYERYEEFFQQQERFLQDGYFTRLIATVTRASESKVRLYMSDTQKCLSHRRSIDDYERVYGCLEGSDWEFITDPHHLIQSVMVQPRQWSYAEGDTAREIPQSLLYEIPLAICTTKAQLAKLVVDIHCPPVRNLMVSNDQISAFKEVNKDIEIFSFRLRHHRDTVDAAQYPPAPERLEGLYAYLHAAMGPQIRDVSLDLIPVRFSDPDDRFPSYPDGIYRFPIEPLLRSPNWHGLKEIMMEGLIVDLQNLRLLVEMISSGTCLDLEDIRLTSGTWAAALDCLRSKAGWQSRLRYAKGAECERMSMAEYGDAFGPIFKWTANRFCEFGPRNGPNKATKYITCVGGVENPLREDVGITEHQNLQNMCIMH